MAFFSKISLLLLIATSTTGFAYDEDDSNYYDEGDNYEYYDEYDEYNDYDNSDRYDRRDRNRHNRRNRHLAREGWDVNPREARNASNCHRYSLEVYGGKGSARIMGLPGTNYIQTQGSKSGWVCFNGYPELELGKLANPQVSVDLYISDFGSFTFYAGDRGSSLINNWYRTYMSM